MTKYIKLDDVKAIIKKHSESNKDGIRNYGYSYREITLEKVSQLICSEKELAEIDREIDSLDIAEMMDVQELPMPPEGTNGQTVGE